MIDETYRHARWNIHGGVHETMDTRQQNTLYNHASYETDPQALFVKYASVPGEDLRCEACALRWLGEATAEGGIRVAKVIDADMGQLREERVRQVPPSREAARQIGQALARMHAAGAPWWGCPPQGWDFTWGDAYVLQQSRIPVVPQQSAPDTWGAFYAEYRVRAFAQQARDEGELDAADVRLIEKLCVRLERGDFDAPQPALVEQRIVPSSGAVTCARLHGDLWAGNVLYDDSATGATLIDPLAHGGHAETDLAMLQLFGYPYLDEVLAAYNEISPLADGWQDRVPLHQLAPLLHHVVLYDGPYVASALRVVRRYV